MSKRHQSSRRRSYGRRQHEIRERTERQDPILDHDPRSEDEDPSVDGHLRFELAAAGRRLSFAAGD